LGTQPRFQFVVGFFETFWWMGNSKGFPTSHYMQDLDLYCRSYGYQWNSFHLRVGQATQKLLQRFFYNIKENCATLDRSIPTREALIHSIPISEVKDLTSDVLRALKASLSGKNFEPCLRAQF
jgi:hypothetical protein